MHWRHGLCLAGWLAAGWVRWHFGGRSEILQTKIRSKWKVFTYAKLQFSHVKRWREEKSSFFQTKRYKIPEISQLKAQLIVFQSHFLGCCGEAGENGSFLIPSRSSQRVWKIEDWNLRSQKRSIFVLHSGKVTARWLENGGPGLRRCISYIEKWGCSSNRYVSLPEGTFCTILGGYHSTLALDGKKWSRKKFHPSPLSLTRWLVDSWQ